MLFEGRNFLITILLIQLLITIVGIDVPFIVISIVGTAIAYVWCFLIRGHLFEAMYQHWLLTAFVIQGILWCLLSIAGIVSWFTFQRDFGVDIRYLPRQAYYLFFFPLLAVAPYFPDKQLCMDLLHKYGRWMVPILFGINVFLTDSVCMSNVQLLWVGILALWSNGYKMLDVINFILILCSAAFSPQMAQLVIAILFAGVWILRRWKILRWLGCMTLPIVLISSFVLPQINGVIDWAWQVDVNTGWRLEYWADEATAIVDTYGMGIGFGTTYASYEFSEPQSEMIYNTENGFYGPRPFSQNDDYTKEERPFVTASHNSFVSVAFRQGILGLVLLVGSLVVVWKKIFYYEGFESGAIIFAFCGSILLISTNVGLESPMYLLPTLGALCLVVARVWPDLANN